MKAASGTLALLALLACVVATSGCPTDVEILNFALNLEYLEANFYSCAVFGHPLNDSLTGGGPTPNSCYKAALSAQGEQYARAIALDEIAHVELLRNALGSAAVKQPYLDLSAAFAAAANAALNTTLQPPFTPYGSDLLFYHGAFIFEDVGVTAYKGAARFISSKDYLETAAGIMAVEAYHAGSVRTLLFENSDEVVFPYEVKVNTIVQAISNLRAVASGANDDAGIIDQYGDFIIAPVDKNAVAFSRTTDQVLKVVYLGGTGKGGFFPNGLNGSIK